MKQKHTVSKLWLARYASVMTAVFMVSLFGLKGPIAVHASVQPDGQQASSTDPVVEPVVSTTTSETQTKEEVAAEATTTKDDEASTTPDEASTTDSTAPKKEAATASLRAITPSIVSSPISIIASAITCDSEADLPNWGDGGPDITPTTASSYVAAHPSCRLVSGWNFQWGLGSKAGYTGVRDPGGSFIGLVSPVSNPYNSWNSFGPTDSSGQASVSVPELDGANDVWIRESLPSGYMTFSEPTIMAVGHKNATSSEMYCAGDVLNYDNYDAIYNASYANTYHCVAFNALKSVTPPPPATTTPCTLSAADFQTARQNGKIMPSSISIASDGKTASFTLTNKTACSADVSLSSYKTYVNQGGPQWLSTQVLFDSTATTTVQASSTATLTVQLPACKAQIDSWFGAAPSHLLDSNPYSYPNIPFVLTWAFSPTALCQNVSNASNTPPTITILGNNPLTIDLNTTFIDPGATASDTEDGNLTSHIAASSTVSTTTVGTYEVVYSVTDSGGLTASSTRTVKVVNPNTNGGGGTNTPPVIDILGDNPMTIDVNTPFIDPGASSTDAEDGDLTSHIIASSTVSTTTVGAYTVTYTVTDSGGLTSTSTRTVNVVNPSTNTGGGGSGGGGTTVGGGANIGFGGGYGVPLMASAIGSLGTAINNVSLSCPLLNSYLRYGANNDPTEVVKLQAFLQRTQGYDVDVNGTFDLKTLAGVNAFQTKYLGDVMGPWGATRSSGYVYITTKKKVNQIACDTAFIINSSEQAIIDAYKASQAANGQNGTTSPDNSTTSPDIGSLGTPSTVAANGTLFDNSNTAGVANASIVTRFWNFLRSLFQIGS